MLIVNSEEEPKEQINSKAGDASKLDKTQLARALQNSVTEKPPPLEAQQKSKKPSALRSIRFYMMLFALTSPFAVTYSKHQINFVILDMIHPSMLKPESPHKHQNDSTPPNMFYFELDNSCPIEPETRERLIKELETSKRVSDKPGEKFMWNPQIQGYLKASYSLGHLPLQIVGSRMSQTYGSHRVMTISSMLMALCSFMAPLLAMTHYTLLMLDLALLGLLAGFMTPSLVNLFSNWLTPAERSFFMSLYLMASRLGSAFSYFLGFRLLDIGFSWQHIFYSAAFICLLFSMTFYILVSNKPKDNRFISKIELDYLASKNRLVRESLETYSKEVPGKSIELKGGQTKPPPPRPRKRAPLLAILTCKAVWAFVVTKYFVKVVGDLAEKELPNYLTRVMHIPKSADGTINALNYIIFSAGCLCSGIIASYMTKNRPFGMSKTSIRKLMQSIASFGCALSLLGAAISICDITVTAISFGCLFALTTFGAGGEAQMPVDLSERYSDTIYALGSSIASTSGIIAPIVVGVINRDGGADQDKWKWIWLGAGTLSALGGFVFLFFADAKIQSFDSIGLYPENSDSEAGKTEKKEADSDKKEAGKTKEATEEDKTVKKEDEVSVGTTEKDVSQGHQAPS